MNRVNTHRHATWVDKPSEAVAFQRRRERSRNRILAVKSNIEFYDSISANRENIRDDFNLKNNEEGD